MIFSNYIKNPEIAELVFEHLLAENLTGEEVMTKQKNEKIPEAPVGMVTLGKFRMQPERRMYADNLSSAASFLSWDYSISEGGNIMGFF